MRDLQENKLTMYEAVKSCLGNNEVIVATIPALINTRKDFLEKIEKIKDAAKEQREATAGKRAAKQEAEDVLISELMKIGSALYAYGRRVGNTEIQAIANVRESKLAILRDTELVSRAKSIHKTAEENAVGLKDYGVTAEMIIDLAGKIDMFSAALGERESSAAKSTGATASLVNLFALVDELLNEELDRLVELLRESNTNFYNEYFAARVIKDLGIRHREAKPKPPTP